LKTKIAAKERKGKERKKEIGRSVTVQFVGWDTRIKIGVCTSSIVIKLGNRKGKRN